MYDIWYEQEHVQLLMQRWCKCRLYDVVKMLQIPRWVRKSGKLQTMDLVMLSTWSALFVKRMAITSSSLLAVSSLAVCVPTDMFWVFACWCPSRMTMMLTYLITHISTPSPIPDPNRNLIPNLNDTISLKLMTVLTHALYHWKWHHTTACTQCQYVWVLRQQNLLRLHRVFVKCWWM